MICKRLHGALAFPDRETGFLAFPGCRKVRRGDDSRDGSPSPASGSRRPTGWIAPPGGTAHAAEPPKGARGMATSKAIVRALLSAAPPASGAPPARAWSVAARRGARCAAVDTEVASDIVDSPKKAAIPRGSTAFYPLMTGSFLAASGSCAGPAAALRHALHSSLHPVAGLDLARRVARESATCVRAGTGALEAETSRARSASGMRLAGFPGRAALPRGIGGRVRRRRDERIRLGIGQARLRSRRNAAHLLHGCVRARGHGSGA